MVLVLPSLLLIQHPADDLAKQWRLILTACTPAATWKIGKSFWPPRTICRWKITISFYRNFQLKYIKCLGKAAERGPSA